MITMKQQTEALSAKDSFSLALSRAPTKVGNALRKLGVSDWDKVRSLDPETILKLGGFGRKTCEDFKRWRESCLSDGYNHVMVGSVRGNAGECDTVPRCRDYHAYREWIRAVFDLLFTKPSSGCEAVLEYRLALLDAAEPRTLQETGTLVLPLF